ncbi:MAG: hypothetical protein JWQ02_2415 [Capsulimonas sp.]|jgi:hypothetical protein|nr:hypothetical protein [Capsulimonas sp.]
MNPYAIGEIFQRLMRGDINLQQAQVALVDEGITRQKANTYTARVQAHTWSITEATANALAGRI